MNREQILSNLRKIADQNSKMAAKIDFIPATILDFSKTCFPQNLRLNNTEKMQKKD
jgi:hypothetical protein